MPNALIVRPIARADFDQWLPLWQGYNKFYGRDALPAEITQMTWFRFFDDYEPVHALVVEKDGELLGLAHYLFHRSTIQIEPACYLQDLFTKETARRAGVGRILLEAVFQAARIAGLPRVYWHTQETNATARKLYDKIAEQSGFVVYRKQI